MLGEGESWGERRGLGFVCKSRDRHEEPRSLVILGDWYCVLKLCTENMQRDSQRGGGGLWGRIPPLRFSWTRENGRSWVHPRRTCMWEFLLPFVLNPSSGLGSLVPESSVPVMTRKTSLCLWQEILAKLPRQAQEGQLSSDGTMEEEERGSWRALNLHVPFVVGVSTPSRPLPSPDSRRDPSLHRCCMWACVDWHEIFQSPPFVRVARTCMNSRMPKTRGWEDG